VTARKPAAGKLDPYTLGALSRRFKLLRSVMLRPGKPLSPYTEGRVLELDRQADQLRAEARAIRLESRGKRKAKR
jgi:hypothetical protein